MFIVITGLDGSGTSSIAKRLSELDKGSVVLKTPSAEFSDRVKIDSIVREYSQGAHYLYYLSSVLFMSDYIRKNYDYINHNVYCVRYLIDTVVSHKVAGLEVSLDYETYNILKPDITIFVFTKEIVRQNRISKRGKSCLDYMLDNDIIRNKFIAEFKTNLDNYVTIDNTGTDIDSNINEFYQKYIKRSQ